MQNIGNDEYEDQLMPEFVNGVKNMVERIRKRVRPKRSINGTILSGPELALWIETIVHALNNGRQPELGSTWKRVIEKKYVDVSKECFDNYKQVMIIENMPISEEEITKQHEGIMNNISQQFTSDTQGVFDEEMSKKYLNELFSNSQRHLEALLTENENESRKLCTDLTRNLEKEYLSWLSDTEELKVNMNFDHLLQQFEDCKTVYHIACGPCKEVIWVNFEADVLKE